jgi:hypothetical protein
MKSCLATAKTCRTGNSNKWENVLMTNMEKLLCYLDDFFPLRVSTSSICQKVDFFTPVLIFQEDTPDHIVRSMATKFPGIRTAFMPMNRNVTDGTLRFMLENCTKLQLLDISMCLQLTRECLSSAWQNPTDDKFFLKKGCWRLYDSSSESLSPVEILHAQIQALKSSTEEGFAKAMEFISPEMKEIVSNNLKYVPSYALLLSSDTYMDITVLEQRSSLNNLKMYIVGFKDTSGQIEGYFWTFENVNQKWKNDNVVHLANAYAFFET